MRKRGRYGVIESLRAARPQAKLLGLRIAWTGIRPGSSCGKERTALVGLHRMLREGEVEKLYTTS